MKNRVISIFLVLSLLINFALVIYIYKNIKDNEIKKNFYINQANCTIAEAVDISSEIINYWDRLTNEQIIKKLSDIDKDLNIAMILLSMADYYFYPIKTYVHSSKDFYYRAVEKGKNEELYEAYKEENTNLKYLNDFLWQSRVDKLSIDEVILRWQNTENK